jgi:CubicO group peptidase (beta-lactamase class C family)
MGEDLPGMRKKGSGWCAYYILKYLILCELTGRLRVGGGWAGTTFFLDPTSGIAVVFGSQMVPPGDEKVIKLQQDLERALYASLEYADLEARPKL